MNYKKLYNSNPAPTSPPIVKRTYMKTFIFCTTLLPLLLLTGCGTIAQIATLRHHPYNGLEDITLQAPNVKDQTIIIPLNLSESDFRYNSGMIIQKIKTKTVDESVYFYIVTCVAGGSFTGIKNPAIQIKNPNKTSYKIYYVDPDDTKHDIGIIDIKE